MMKKYEFSIIASGLDPQADDFECQFYSNGCDDATVSFQKGHIIVDFAREAATLDAAIDSAIRNVLSTGARVDRIEPDSLVTLADIARRADLSRAAVSLYARGERGAGFPSPLRRITSDSPLWDWTAVAEWLSEKGTVPPEAVVEARVIKHRNCEIAQTKIEQERETA
jgi:hypothetical protein